MATKREETDASIAATPGGLPPPLRTVVAPPATAEEEGSSLELEEYASTRARRGRCVIINNHHFNQKLTRQSDRDGTEVDAEKLESRFVALGFDVTRHDDLTVTEMNMTLREVSEEDHSDADCFVCVLLSHGEEGVIYGTNGTIKLDALTSRFKGDACPSLAGKPKLFFIQACRGRRYDFGVTLDDMTDSATDSASVRRIPVEADFLTAYSVVPGHFSWRNNVDGSWFVQALCRVLRAHGDRMDLISMLTLVNKLVAFDFESCTDEEFTTGMKQVPFFASTLTKLVYFRPKY